MLYDMPADAGNVNGPCIRLLLVALVMILGDIHQQWQDMPMSWALGALLARLVLALVLVRHFARTGWSAIGFKAFARWCAVERSFVLQVVIIVNVLFPLGHALVVGDPIATVYASVFLGGKLHLLLRFRGRPGKSSSPRGLLPPRTHGFLVPVRGKTSAVGLLFSVHFHRSRNLWKSWR